MIAPYARAAYATGYAEGGEGAFPMPEWVAEHFRESVAAAEELSDNPAVLEGVRRRGRRAAVFVTTDRHRDDIEAKFRALFRPLLHSIMLAARPEIMRELAKLREAVQPADPYRQAVVQALQSIADTGLWNEWIDLVSQAQVEGAALGLVNATIWLATEKGLPLPDFGLSFPAQLQSLRNLGSLPGYIDPESWQAKMLQGMAYQLGGKLADAEAIGASGDDLMALIASELTIEDSYAYLLLDNAIATSTIDAALSGYAEMGVAYVDVFVSPNACDICEPLPLDNPYPITAAPDVPVHPNCRCDLVPSI